MPGLSALIYRVGTYGSFKATMLTNLTERHGLGKLTSRDDDDPSIALLDASAVMLDVLTFYQERIINEGYLHTALERRSVLELARQIGYELAPGVAAGTYLAFILESAAGAPGKVTIPIGTRVQSLPEQDQTPQPFETVEAITAQAVWNEMKPKTTELVLPGFNEDEIYLKGINANLKAGDALLIVGRERIRDSGNENWDFRRIKSLKTVNATDPEESYTRVTLEFGLGSFTPFKMPAQDDPRVYALRQRANVFGYNAPDWKGLTKKVRQDYLGLSSEDGLRDYPDWPNLTIAAVSDAPDESATGTGLYGEYFDDNPYDGQHFKIRKQARTDAKIDFGWGSSSPIPGTLPPDNFSVRWTGWIQPKASGLHTFTAHADDGVRLWINGLLVIDWWYDQPATDRTGTIRLEARKKYDFKLEYYERGGAAEIRLSWAVAGQFSNEIVPTVRLYPRDIHTVFLDLVYPQVRPGGWVVLSRKDYQEVYQVEEAVEDARACLTMSGKCSRLVLKGENLREKFNDWLRQTVVFCQSEELAWAEKPIIRPLSGDTLILDMPITGLLPKRTLIVSGKRCRLKGKEGDFHLRLSDGFHLGVKSGKSVVLLQAPSPLVSGKLRWTVQTDDGQSGMIDTAESKFTFLASESADETVSEVVTIKSVTVKKETTEVVLEQPLTYHYDLATVVVYGNVAPATHGETKKEVLGSGDASRPFQKFILKNSPLTYVSAANPSGSETTLKVRADDIQWKEVDSFYGLEKREHAYITRRDDEGKVAVEFGDGLTGARLPSGQENISAVYRVGIGAAGMVKAGQLTLLISQILGVQKVTNPLAPTGAADPESRDQARQNAPFTVMTLGRVVSLQDFEDFARAFAGIGKAQAEWVWDGESRVVHLTIAASAASGSDYRVPSTSMLYKNLHAGIDAARDATQRLVINTYTPLFFCLKVRVLVSRDYVADKVVKEVKNTLKAAYSFSKRLFGQSVSRGEILALIQGIEGIEASFLDALYLTGQVPSQADLMVAHRARGEGSRVQPADLLLIDPEGISVEAIQS
jgi:hypothetical protein